MTEQETKKQEATEEQEESAEATEEQEESEDYTPIIEEEPEELGVMEGAEPLAQEPLEDIIEETPAPISYPSPQPQVSEPVSAPAPAPAQPEFQPTTQLETGIGEASASAQGAKESQIYQSNYEPIEKRMQAQTQEEGSPELIPLQSNLNFQNQMIEDFTSPIQNQFTQTLRPEIQNASHKIQEEPDTQKYKPTLKGARRDRRGI